MEINLKVGSIIMHTEFGLGIIVDTKDNHGNNVSAHYYGGDVAARMYTFFKTRNYSANSTLTISKYYIKKIYD